MALICTATIATWVSVLIGVFSLCIGGVLGFFATNWYKSKKLEDAKAKSKQIIEDANNEVKVLKKEALIEAREEAIKLKNEVEEELKDRRSEATKLENRLRAKEEMLDKKEEMLDKKSASIDDQKDNLEKKNVELENVKLELEKKSGEISKELERIAGLSKESAKAELVKSIEDDARKEAGTLVKKLDQEARDEAEKNAKEIVMQAIQRCATDHTVEVTVSAVNIPNDEMKGRIIGREGRNIRAIEMATGVDLIVDDTPEAVIISCFDPIRREVARQTLERLTSDGRIHPGRIEEVVEKVKKDLEKTIAEAGENATFDAGVFGINPELVKILGRLKYRTSYGQNVLQHSLETSYIAGLIAGELGADVAVSKRAGLLHDIGKAMDFEVEGTHVSIGVELAKKYKESEAVIHAIEAHHGDVEYKTLEAMIVQVADAISSSRPGARRESLETYIKRLEKLESIANEFKGVQSCYAIQAGREIRVAVKPEEVNDDGIVILAKEIARKIEAELDYPGQIKVNIIREVRSVDYAT